MLDRFTITNKNRRDDKWGKDSPAQHVYSRDVRSHFDGGDLQITGTSSWYGDYVNFGCELHTPGLSTAQAVNAMIEHTAQFLARYQWQRADVHVFPLPQLRFTVTLHRDRLTDTGIGHMIDRPDVNVSIEAHGELIQ